MTMLEQNIGSELNGLSSQEHQKILELISSIVEAKNLRRINSFKLMGSLAHLNINFTEEDLKEARREMLGELRQSKNRKSSVQSFYNEWKKLSLTEQQEFLSLIENADEETITKKTRLDPRGILADIAVDVSPEDFAEARCDMLFNFPKDIEL